MEVDIAMNDVKYKTIFWMNLVLSIFFMLCSAFYFFVNIDYVEASLFGKIFNLTLLFTPIFTIITIYKNDTNLLCRIAFALNVILSITILVLLIRAIANNSLDKMIVVLLFLTPFIINSIQLNKMRKS